MENKKKIKILFFGSGEFPLGTFENLCSNDDFDIVGLVTSKDKPMFKGRKTKSLFEIATEHNVPTLVVGNTFTEEDINWIGERRAFMNVVISFKKLPQEIIRLAGFSFNVHASILPYFRGAAPINHAIRLGCKETGLTAFLLSDKIDCGAIVRNKVVGIFDDDNFESLFDRLAEECVEFTEDTIYRLYNREYTLTHQVDYLRGLPDNAKRWFSAPKIDSYYTKNWMYDLDSVEIKNLYRSIYPNDGLYLHIKCFNRDSDSMSGCVKEFELKIWDFEIKHIEPKLYPCDNGNDECADNDDSASYKTDGKTYFAIPILQSYDEYLFIKEIQMSGKKRMDIESFL